MSDFQYTVVPGKLNKLLAKIREVAVPQKATVRWLESIGFRSKNDRGMLHVLSFIGFSDARRVPTDRWRSYRAAGYKRVLAEGIREGYAQLFQVYPDAWQRDTEELESFFTTRTTAGKQVISKTVSTFSNLVQLADMEAVPATRPEPQPVAQPQQPQPAPRPRRVESPGPPSVHIDLQIHISPEATADQIEQVFAAIAKHLYSQ